MTREALVMVLLCCCSGPPGAAFVDHGPDASIGVVWEDEGVAAYVCGATDDTRPTWTRWFTTTDVADDAVEIELEGWTLDVARDGDRLSVDLVGPEDEAASFEPTEVDEGGLFEHDGACRDGVIAGHGASTGAFCVDPDTLLHVEPVGTIQLSVDTIEVRPVAADGTLGEAVAFERVGR